MVKKRECRKSGKVKSKSFSKKGSKLISSVKTGSVKKNASVKNIQIPRPHLTFGQKLSDKLSYYAGSWGFITIFILFLIFWMWFNVRILKDAVDPYPFILLNLMLSCLAALQAPVILMSQNRAAERDRHRAEMDYIVNRKAEREVANMQRDLDEIKDMIKFLHYHSKKDHMSKTYRKK